MLTYTLGKGGGQSLYEQLYRHIRSDILAGRLLPGERLPSKRTLAEHLQVSVVTVETAYGQLEAEGYIRAEEKRGYFIADVETPPHPMEPIPVPQEETTPHWTLDLASNAPAAEYFPFAAWARLMRRTLLDRSTDLLRPTPSIGAPELRQAIAAYLREFRGMAVGPEQIVIGAGTETLYLLLTQLLGREKVYAVEDPGYGKIGRIYAENGAAVRRVTLDGAGLSARALRQSGADVVHLSPSHHYPTGIVMPITRRQELLRWAGEAPGRWILEDDYDSEFRFVGRPIPTLFSSDRRGRVIYLNTFSKTIAPSIRISYMILPPELMEEYRRRLGFYACTVAAFEQYTLAAFLAEGHYERHLRSMKTRYHRKRDAVIDAIRGGLPGARIREQDAGLHFLVELDTALPDETLRRRAAEQGIRLALLSDYYAVPETAMQHVLVVNYSGIDVAALPAGLQTLNEIVKETRPCTTN
ncbi:MAG: PLP-dependent aminotransferase family protein [Oscillospiraceae bacterium]|nr:PLP-dependent aminotransferase family protein [Oscillospiraceae bacterium]